MKLLMNIQELEALPARSIVAVCDEQLERVAMQKNLFGFWAAVGFEGVVDVKDAPPYAFPVLLLWQPGQTEEMSTEELIA
jgi:hypothetical protein